MTDLQLVVSADAEAPDTSTPWTRLGPAFTPADLEALRADVLAVFGDDHFVACVAESYSGVLAPLPVGSDSLLAGQVHRTSSVDKILTGLSSGAFEQLDVKSLRITDTASASSLTGFSFGAGLIEAAFQARENVGGDANFDEIIRRLRGANSSLSSAGAKVTVDWQPIETGCGWIHASTLKRSWLRTRVSEDGEPRLRVGDSVLEWVGNATRLGKLVGGGKPARTFDAIHIDADTGYVVDGRIFRSCPRIIQVRPGPLVRVAALT